VATGLQVAAQSLPEEVRTELARVERVLSALWNLGNNVLLAWSHCDDGLVVLSVRHYAIAELVHAADGALGAPRDPPAFVSEVLAGSKYLEGGAFAWACRAFGREPQRVRSSLRAGNLLVAQLVSGMVRRHGVSLVNDRAVILLDAVAFSLRSPLDQMAMLNSLAYSVNSAYSQLLSKGVHIDFARTTTGDGFYIWNRATTPEANGELYQLMMMLLADNAVAQSKARTPWVPQLRAAFHVGEHYEFHQVEGLNPTPFSYIVGQVTVDLARILGQALSGQILIGDFPGTIDFVRDTAASLDQLHGLEISGGRIESIRCYLTGVPARDGGFCVNRYGLIDKHGSVRSAYNAKINIHRLAADPIFLGLRTADLRAFPVAGVEALPA
jgi:hypothetical protein